MTTVLEVVEQAARDCSISKIVGLTTSTTETALMLRDKLNETVEELLDRLDLPYPITVDFEVVGTGVETYALPSDFIRTTRDDEAVYEKTAFRRCCIPIASNGSWTHLKQFGASGSARYYRVTGDESSGFQISFYRPLSANQTVVVSYVSKNWAKNAATPKSTWSLPDDVLLLPAALVRLGVIWRVKAKKGMVYSDVQAEYEIRVSRAINDGRGIRTVQMGDAPRRDGPIKIQTPDYINFT
jgi:hypothetical protein